MIKLRAMATKVDNKSGWLLYITAVLILVIVCVQACQRPARSNPSHPPPTSTNVFDAYLNTNIPPADGFDFPVGDANAKGLYRDLATGIEYSGWRIDTHFAENYQLGIHTGEDWNGNGGGNTDLGQDVRREFWSKQGTEANGRRQQDSERHVLRDSKTSRQFHGWIKEWDNNGPRHLSWGCVVMHIYDIEKLYDQTPEGTMVVIL
jgi:hypothetical protein